MQKQNTEIETVTAIYIGLIIRILIIVLVVAMDLLLHWLKNIEMVLLDFM